MPGHWSEGVTGSRTNIKTNTSTKTKTQTNKKDKDKDKDIDKGGQINYGQRWDHDLG